MLAHEECRLRKDTWLCVHNWHHQPSLVLTMLFLAGCRRRIVIVVYQRTEYLRGSWYLRRTSVRSQV